DSGAVVISSASQAAGIWAVNLLMVDTMSGKSRWLFAGTGQIIHDVIEAHEQLEIAFPAQNRVKALAMIVTDADTDKDGALTDRDRQSVYLYRSGDPRAARVMTADAIDRK